MIVTAHNRARRHLRRLSKHSFPSYRVYEGETSVRLLPQPIKAQGFLLGFWLVNAIVAFAMLVALFSPDVSPEWFMRIYRRTVDGPHSHAKCQTFRFARRGPE